MTYAVEGRIARITLNRPERGNGITLDLPRELAACVELADLDPSVHVIALAGIGRHTKEGYALQQRAAEAGFKQAVRDRDEPFGDFGPSTFKG